MHIPASTYRLQLHKDFTLTSLQRIIDYLETLGVTTIYASPVMQATPGSMHGYDVTDAGLINAQLGTEDQLRAVIRELHKKDMHWLQDIVPNHMAFHVDNARLMDVLERGPESPYRNYFDIDWNHPDPDLNDKLMVPFLGDDLDVCLSRGEIRLAFEEDGIMLKYFDKAYPFSLSAYATLIEIFKQKIPGSTMPSILMKMTAAAAGATREVWHESKRAFMEAVRQTPGVDDVLEKINADPAQLQRLCGQQYYLLCFWKETDRRINYRRFFTVNELICLRMEDQQVFDEYHAYLHTLYKEKLVHGFRIDHIDGLHDPGQYIERLRELMGEACYIIAEKILEVKEQMPRHWQLQGTSGYEFLSVVNQLFTDSEGAEQLLRFYQQILPDLPPYKELIRSGKQLILEHYMQGEWNNLTHLIRTLDLSGGFPDVRIKQALESFMLSLPVYRLYPEKLPLRGIDLEIAHEAFDRAVAEDPEHRNVLDHLRSMFTAVENGDKNDRILFLLKRLMQFTGPLTAKGVEDTAFYIYNPLISHDEVGDSPATLTMTVQAFHEKMQRRLADSPLSLNATATHDTKRGEDARVRINLLSRMPDQWQQHVRHWFDINSVLHENKDGKEAPTRNDEYFIYQSMVGGFPHDFHVTSEWIGRAQAYLNKALREAKVNSNWSEPDEQYEKGCARFIERILDPDHRFLSSFVPFVRTVCDHAIVYSLGQTLAKLTAPGIPDIYQGCELWDLSFVDPDNRRPVDYDKRMEFLFQLVIKDEKGTDAVFDYLREHREAGIEKLYLTWKTLNLRKSRPALFTEGEYIPLAITGDENIAVGYVRHLGDDWVLVAFPLRWANDGKQAVTEVIRFIVLPDGAPRRWRNVFTGEQVEVVNQISLADLFRNFPVALLVDHPGR